MFWKLKSRRKPNEGQSKVINKEIILNAIEELNTGNIDYISIAYGAFATMDVSLIEKAGKAIGRVLTTYNDSQLIKFEEQFRKYEWPPWSFEWRNTNILYSKNFVDAIEDWKYILILGSFHPNGYFREQCTIELSKLEGTLPYLLLRLNDWVELIRIRSHQLILQKVSYCSIFEVISSMEYWDKVNNSQRRNPNELIKLYKELINKLERDIQLINWFILSKFNFKSRKSFYRLLFTKQLLCIDEANLILEKEGNNYNKSIIINGILSFYKIPMEQVDLYMNNRSSLVRKKSIQYKYATVKNTWNGLDVMLLDNNRSIREFAAFIIKKHTTINLLDYYAEALNKADPVIGIIGIGEFGNKNHSQLLLPFLNNENEKIVKITLLSLCKLIGLDDNNIFWTYLFDNRVSVSKAAYLSIRRRKIYHSSQKLYSEFKECFIPHVRRNLLLLLLQSNSWSRIPYLLLLYNYDDINLRYKIRMSIGRRNIYGNITSTEANLIRNILKEKNNELPETLIKEIEFDLKYIVYKN